MTHASLRPLAGLRAPTLAALAVAVVGLAVAVPVDASPTSVPVAVAAGYIHTCVVQDDGNVDCYGYDLDGQATDYALGDAEAVSAGTAHTCVLKANGNVDCFGQGLYGQTADYLGGDAIAVSVGALHSCVLKANGNVDCYGHNGYGQSVDYTGGDATAVSAGYLHTCVLKSDGDVDCYGYDRYGQAADYTGGDAIAVSGQGYHTCVLRSSHDVDCYGYNAYGQAADYSGGDAVSVAAHLYHTCIVLEDGDVDCRGRNTKGQANDYLGGDAVAAATGTAHTCILTESAYVDCYGDNAYGAAVDYDGSTDPVTRTLVHQDKVTFLPGVPYPAVGVPFAPTPDHEGSDEQTLVEAGTVTVRDHADGARLCVEFTPTDQPTVPIVCVSRLLLGEADGEIERGDTPLLVAPPTEPVEVPDAGPVPLVPAGATPNAGLTWDVTYTHDASRVTFLASALGTAETWSPFVPSTEGVDWFLAHGDDVPLTITASLYVGTANQGPGAVSIPYLGQVLAAAAAPAGALA